MNNKLKDILSNLNNDIEQEKLLEYLNNQLSEEEQHQVESNMNDDAFFSDAMDGLQEMENKKQLPLLVHQLNTGLKKQLEIKRQRRDKRKIPPQPWVYYTIVILLLLAVIAYVIIKKLES